MAKKRGFWTRSTPSGSQRPSWRYDATRNWQIVWPPARSRLPTNISIGKRTQPSWPLFTSSSPTSKGMYMSKPVRVLKTPEQAAAILSRFGRPGPETGMSYATVRDYCESRDELPQITPIDGDLKNVQRPWTTKAILANVAPGGRLLEIGGGEPIVCGLLAELGYDVTLVDPYDGFGNGPTDYARYVAQFPHVRIAREYFRADLPLLQPGSFDAIFSISVLEHLPADSLTSCFDA